MLKTTAPFNFSPCYQILLKGLLMANDQTEEFLCENKFLDRFNRVFEKITLQTLVLEI